MIVNRQYFSLTHLPWQHICTGSKCLGAPGKSPRPQSILYYVIFFLHNFPDKYRLGRSASAPNGNLLGFLILCFVYFVVNKDLQLDALAYLRKPTLKRMEAAASSTTASSRLTINSTGVIESVSARAGKVVMTPTGTIQVSTMRSQPG